MSRFGASLMAGLDPARYASTANGEVAEKQFFTFESQISDKERFRESDPLAIRCISCEQCFALDGIQENSTQTIQPIGVVCSSCNGIVPTPSIAVQLETKIRAHISKYYLGYTICDGDACGARTRMMSVYGRRCLGLSKEGCKGTVRLEVGRSFVLVKFLANGSTRIYNFTTSCCIIDTCLMVKRQ